MTALAQGRYRVGRSLGRTLYRHDQLIGLLDTAEMAQQCADALNAQQASERTVNGRCGHRRPVLLPGIPVAICALVAGHEGWHQGDDTSEWGSR